QEEATRFANAPIRVINEPPSLGNLAPEFVDLVEHALVERFGQARLPYLGLNVRTSCDANLERAARAALEQGLQRIDERQGYRGRVQHLLAAAQKAHLETLKREFPSGPPIGHIVEGVITQVLDGDDQAGWATVDLGAVQGALELRAAPDRYNPKGL